MILLELKELKSDGRMGYSISQDQVLLSLSHQDCFLQDLFKAQGLPLRINFCIAAKVVEQVKWKLENPALSFLPCLFFEIGSHVAQAGLRLRARIISKCHHVWLTSFLFIFLVASKSQILLDVRKVGVLERTQILKMRK